MNFVKNSRIFGYLKGLLNPERMVPLIEQNIIDNMKEEDEQLESMNLEDLECDIPVNYEMNELFSTDELLLQYADYNYGSEALGTYFQKICPFIEHSDTNSGIETNLNSVCDFLMNHNEETKNKFGSLLEINLDQHQKITVVGDTHGQALDTLEIFKLLGGPSEDHLYLFTGDYVDRGPHSFENFITLLYLQSIFNFENCFMLRGNHEELGMNWNYGFMNDMVTRFPTFPNIFEQFSLLYEVLPIAAVINKGIFCVHGGIGIVDEETRYLDKIREFRPPTKTVEESTGLRERERSDIYYAMLWSDPLSSTKGLNASPRGGGTKTFGDDVTLDFLEKNQLNGVIRSHESHKAYPDGYFFDHDRKVLTLFSCPFYCGFQSNWGSVATIYGMHDNIIPEDGKFEITVLKESAYNV